MHTTSYYRSHLTAVERRRLSRQEPTPLSRQQIVFLVDYAQGGIRGVSIWRNGRELIINRRSRWIPVLLGLCDAAPHACSMGGGLGGIAYFLY